MSFHVRDDFKAGAPVSQVPASWFNKVASFLNNLVGGYGVTLVKAENGPSVIEVDQTAIPSAQSVSREVGTPVDGKDYPNVLDTSGGTWVWSAGGANGLELDCYCQIAPQTSGSAYTVYQRARLSFSKDGLLVHGELLSDRIRIQAKNA